MNAVIPVNTVSATATQPSGNAGNGWALAFPGNLGNIDAYIQSVNRVPMLSAEEEQRLAREYRDDDNLDSARRLVLSHLRLVVSIARGYLGYGLPHADLIQEGNIGLMKAVKRFDPDQGVRLVSYAMHWIKAEMHEYILKNWRMVKVATTKAQRKLFFNLRSHKQDAQATFTSDEIDAVAAELNVKGTEVREMETRLSGGDIALEGQMDDGEESFAPIAYLADTHNEPTRVIEARGNDRMQSEGIESALAKLDDRSRRIIEARWLNVNDDGSGGSTLHELADEFGVSAERIRQIEAAAMKKMKGALQAFA
ncbi:RNA polymerase sigma factor RpoH [Ralstonia sp. SET104]|uniref:RNA polymerase sigma factor RpoH n=1 Tax=Ralstonia sp. SET104 TaxID=2448774 RepID=UPI000F56C124|nr:RNA polymerase sigma factor RpoH [Ralstonia sp. SET104]GCB06812.1 RNA polymerase sigma factor RpoH [Ralstonia sp. SET104]